MNNIPAKIEKICENRLSALRTAIDKVIIGENPPNSLYWLMLGDITNLVKYYILVKTGQFHKAYNLSQSLDMAGRHNISVVVYDFIEKHCS